MLTITVARKPLEGTVAANALKWGTGGLNIDACRIGTPTESLARSNKIGDNGWKNSSGGKNTAAIRQEAGLPPQGRWPANLILCPEAARSVDEQSGLSSSPPVGSVAKVKANSSFGTFATKDRVIPNGYGDTGGASRFFKIVG